MKTYRIFNKSIKWDLDEDGMLRCHAAVLKTCVMDYCREELGKKDIPDEMTSKEVLRLYVPPEEIGNRESLKSLEGKPISVDHEWQVGGSIDSVGNIAGAPTFDEASGYLFVDLLVTDPATIARITSASTTVCDEKLVDLSASYRSIIDWTPGITLDGLPYDGIQRDLKYNHIALLPKGYGRAGEDVRILNKKSRKPMSDYTQLKLWNSTVRVLNEDVNKLQNEMDTKDDETSKAIDPAKLNDALTTIETLNGQLETLTSERDGYLGQVNQLKEEIERVTNPNNMQYAMEGALEEQQDSDDILDAFDLEEDMDNRGKYKNEDRKDDGDDDTKKMKNSKRYGHDLRSHTVQAVRLKNGKKTLDAETLKNEDIIKGMFLSLKEVASLQKKRKVVNGASVMQVSNSTTTSKKDDVVPLARMSAEDRKMLRFKTKGA